MNRPNCATASVVSGTSTSISPCAGRFEPGGSVKPFRKLAPRSYRCPLKTIALTAMGLPIFDFWKSHKNISLERRIDGHSLSYVLRLLHSEIVTLTVKERAWYKLAERTQRKVDGHEGS